MKSTIARVLSIFIQIFQGKHVPILRETGPISCQKVKTFYFTLSSFEKCIGEVSSTLRNFKYQEKSLLVFLGKPSTLICSTTVSECDFFFYKPFKTNPVQMWKNLLDVKGAESVLLRVKFQRDTGLMKQIV